MDHQRLSASKAEDSSPRQIPVQAEMLDTREHGATDDESGSKSQKTAQISLSSGNENFDGRMQSTSKFDT